jgi:hypothetical protein
MWSAVRDGGGTTYSSLAAASWAGASFLNTCVCPCVRAVQLAVMGSVCMVLGGAVVLQRAHILLKTRLMLQHSLRAAWTDVVYVFCIAGVINGLLGTVMLPLMFVLQQEVSWRDARTLPPSRMCACKCAWVRALFAAGERGAPPSSRPACSPVLVCVPWLTWCGCVLCCDDGFPALRPPQVLAVPLVAEVLYFSLIAPLFTAALYAIATIHPATKPRPKHVARPVFGLAPSRAVRA